MLNAILVSLVAGVGGTGLGGLLAFFIGKGQKVQSVLFSLTAGIMLSIVCFELIPEAIFTIDIILVCIVVIIGALVVHFFENVFASRKGSKKALFMVGLAIALHNFPEGLVLGSAMQNFTAISLLIALHDVPEGIAVALPYVQDGKRAKGVLYAFLSGVTTVFGAIVGVSFSSVSTLFSGICLAFASGAMIYVVFSELLPHTNDLLKEKNSGIIISIGVIIGLIVIHLL